MRHERKNCSKAWGPGRPTIVRADPGLALSQEHKSDGACCQSASPTPSLPHEESRCSHCSVPGSRSWRCCLQELTASLGQWTGGLQSALPYFYPALEGCALPWCPLLAQSPLESQGESSHPKDTVPAGASTSPPRHNLLRWVLPGPLRIRGGAKGPTC